MVVIVVTKVILLMVLVAISMVMVMSVVIMVTMTVVLMVARSGDCDNTGVGCGGNDTNGGSNIGGDSNVGNHCGANTFPMRKRLPNPSFQNLYTSFLVCFLTFSLNKCWWRLPRVFFLEDTLLIFARMLGIG